MMKEVSVEEAISILSGPDGQYSKESMIFQHAILTILAQGRPATVEAVASKTDFPRELVQNIFEQMKTSCYEFDNNALVGAALTLNPTPHRLNINGQTLYAWCALDTLFLPAYIGHTVSVTSICAVTQKEIFLEVSPHGIVSSSPEEVAVSVVVNTNCTSGPEGSFCKRVHFFADPHAGKQWASHQDDVAVFRLEEAYEIADEVYIKPYLNLLGGKIC